MYPTTRLQRYFTLGTDRRRQVLAWQRQVRQREEIRERRHIARAAARDATLSIPRDDGYTVAGPGTLPGTADVVRTIADRAAHADPDASRSSKPQIIDGLLDAAALTLDDPILQLVMSDGVLAGIANYLGMAPILSRVEAKCAVPSGEPSNSQLHHCDWCAVSQIKVFVYCTDVAEANGPLVVVPTGASRRVRRQLRYTYAGARYRVSDDEMHALVMPDDERPLTGPAGTVIFADTCQCFHLGSRVQAGAASRVVVVYQFLTPTAFSLPLSRDRAAPFAHLAHAGLSPLQRAVLGVIDAPRTS